MCTYLKSAEVWVFPLNYLLLLLLSLRSKHHWMVERPHCTLISTCCVYIYMCMYTRGHRACSVHTPNSVPALKPHDGTMFTLPSGLEFRCCFKDPWVVHTVLFCPLQLVSTQRAWISHIGVTLHLKRRNSVNPPPDGYYWLHTLHDTSSVPAACFDCTHTPQTVNCVNMC